MHCTHIRTYVLSTQKHTLHHHHQIGILHPQYHPAVPASYLLSFSQDIHIVTSFSVQGQELFDPFFPIAVSYLLLHKPKSGSTIANQAIYVQTVYTVRNLFVGAFYYISRFTFVSLFQPFNKCITFFNIFHS